MTKILFLIVVLVFIVTSCFYDERVVGVNDSDYSIHMGICLLNPNERTDIISPFFCLAPGQKSPLYLDQGLWYDEMGADSILVVVFPSTVEDSITWANGYREYEAIIQRKAFHYKTIATRDISKKFGKTTVVYKGI